MHGAVDFCNRGNDVYAGDGCRSLLPRRRAKVVFVLDGGLLSYIEW